ncbi:hypothetical protein SAMN05216264_1052 [Pseudomonas marincola]|nr:hypothetical protein SAMN05216264_1052 [Pseudomonas marincola]
MIQSVTRMFDNHLLQTLWYCSLGFVAEMKYKVHKDN